MSKLLSFILRYGPLVAAFALGLQALLPASGDAIAAQIVSVLGAFGVQPDQAAVGAVGEVIAGATALVGVARKLYALVYAYFDSIP